MAGNYFLQIAIKNPPKCPKTLGFLAFSTGFFLAGDEGFEPPQTESETGASHGQNLHKH
jgi:hypothetical protein